MVVVGTSGLSEGSKVDTLKEVQILFQVLFLNFLRHTIGIWKFGNGNEMLERN